MLVTRNRTSKKVLRKKFYILTKNQVKRSEADMNIQNISCTVKQDKKECDKILVQKTCCEIDKLKVYCTKRDLVTEIEELWGVLPERIGPPAIDYSKTSIKKSDLLQVVCKYKNYILSMTLKQKEQ